MDTLPCVILAGGKSSRMGQDKCFLPYKNTTLIEYQYKRLKKIFKNVYISSKTNKFDFDANLILDEKSSLSSPLIALNSICNYLKSDRFFLITVDTPLVSENSINKIIEQSNNSDITIALTSDDRTHNLCGVFNTNIKPKIEIMLKNNNHKILALAKSVNFKTISIENSKDFINLNTKEDYKKVMSQ